MIRGAIITACLAGSLSFSTTLEAWESSCFLQHAGSIQNVTGHNCPGIAPFLKVEASYRCEACGDLGSLEDIDATGYGSCNLTAPSCPPFLRSIDYETRHLNINIQNRKIFFFCQNNGVTVGTAFCTCPTCTSSPIIISLDDASIRLTSVEKGVVFDLDADGALGQTAWTEARSDEAFLALDRNENGRIDDGTELFGDNTPQPIPDPSERNGFAALAVFDDSLNGGNEDGLIDPSDNIFSSLQLWVDSNHNGISEPDELMSLLDGGVVAFDLEYRQSRRTDRHGNEFRFRSTVEMQDRVAIAWDVFFVQQEQ